jgi:hypothetical protein
LQAGTLALQSFMQNGTYKYFLNGKPTGIVETFSIENLPDGSKFTRSTRDAKSFGTEFTVETIEQNGRFQNCKIYFKTDETEVRANYDFSEKSFHLLREINGENVQDETFDLPENCVFFPLMRCFQGETILRVAEGFSTVLVPDIQNPKDIENLLKPIFDERTAEKIGRQTIGLHQKFSVAAEADLYRYFSKNYDENSCFCIDKSGFLVAYIFAQSANKIWEISLEFKLMFFEK